MGLFNYEKCVLLSAKANQKRLDSRRIPEVDFTDILNDIQSYIDEYIKMNTSDKLRIELYDKYFDDKFKEQGISFFKQGPLLMPVLVGLLESHFGYKAEYVSGLYDAYLTIEFPKHMCADEYDGEAVRAQYKKVHSTI